MTRIDVFASASRSQVARFCNDESGATAVEYAMVASGVGAFIAATVVTLGGSVKNFFTTLAGLFPGS